MYCRYAVDSPGAVATDFDGDGRLELLVSHGESAAQPLSIYKVNLVSVNPSQLLSNQSFQTTLSWNIYCIDILYCIMYTCKHEHTQWSENLYTHKMYWIVSLTHSIGSCGLGPDWVTFNPRLGLLLWPNRVGDLICAGRSWSALRTVLVLTAAIPITHFLVAFTHQYAWSLDSNPQLPNIVSVHFGPNAGWDISPNLG